MNATLESHPNRYELALTMVRIMVGIIFVAHGVQKFVMMGFAGLTGMFTQIGAPFPAITAPLVLLVEVLAGLALVFGLLTRLAAFGLAVDMVGAMLIVHLPGGFFLPDGVEFAMLLFVTNVAFMIAGAGRFSLDAMLAKRRRGSVAAGSPEGSARRAA